MSEAATPKPYTSLRHAAGVPDLDELATERLFVLEALTHSGEQLRKLPSVIDEARGERATLTPLDASKLVAATIAVNGRLKEQLADIDKAIRAAHIAAEKAR